MKFRIDNRPSGCRAWTQSRIVLVGYIREAEAIKESFLRIYPDREFKIVRLSASAVISKQEPF